MVVSVADLVAHFGEEVRRKLSNPAITGAPEDQLRGPLQSLLPDLSRLAGVVQQVTLVGETTLSAQAIRPDFAVTKGNTLVGFIEVKAPGKGANPRRFTDAHDKAQWTRLQLLPNLIYTDGQSFSLWQEGQLVRAVDFDGDLYSAGRGLKAPVAILDLLREFMGWQPIPPDTPRKLAETSARLCRLLRDEVLEEVRGGLAPLTSLAEEWRSLLFPEADDAQFADGYAQAVTFGLLMARARGLPLDTGLSQVSQLLRQSNSTLIGAALRLLTDNDEIRDALGSALKTLAVVLNAVDWKRISRGKADAWLYFYEEFLAVYDSDLRRKTGSYYTPPEVVDAMVRLTDEALRDPALFALPRGLAEREVALADPAVGTGTFLLGVLRRIADTVARDQGPGAVGPALEAAAARLHGFELQFGPYAVAQLRLLAEMQALIGSGSGTGSNIPVPNLYVTDTLGDPYAQQTQFSSLVAPIGDSRREADRVKREAPITVVIGNPPYKVDAAGRGGWIEHGSPNRLSPMDLWTPPADWGLGAHAKHLKNLYVYFWRWATWKVFGSGFEDTTGIPAGDRAGAVCFITASGFLSGPGFARMRADMRASCSDIWVIDCSPEGRQPAVNTRVFEGVQQEICIVLAVRRKGTREDTPARVRYRALPKATRDVKFAALGALSLTDAGWTEAETEWRAPLLPPHSGGWGQMCAIEEMFSVNLAGVMPCRTWVIAPDDASLRQRWRKLVGERDADRKQLMFHPDRDRTLGKTVSINLGRHRVRPISVDADSGDCVPPVRFGWRSLDRQWIIPDHRLLSQGRPELWAIEGERQVFGFALDRVSPSNGPAITFSAFVPDKNFFRGNSAGRAFPLWLDPEARDPNLKPALLAHLSTSLGRAVTAPDLLSYIAALLAHPGFERRFRDDLLRPGLRVPLTADPALFAEAAALGARVVWLHCYGERFSDPAQGRPYGPPRLPPGIAPQIPLGGTIPGAPEPLPDELVYDAATCTLHVGKGRVENVPHEVVAYQVSGRPVLRQWFSYRRRDRTRPVIGERKAPSPLEAIQPDGWIPEYTEDLLNLIHVLALLVDLEPAQDDLLARVCAGPMIDARSLEAAGALVAPPKATRSGKKDAALGDLFNAP